MQNQMEHFNRSIRLFYLYRIISRLYLHLSVLVVYLVSSHISYLNIGFILASYGVAIMISKPMVVPLIRLLSIKKVIILGEWFKCLGVLGLGLSGNFIPMLIASQMLIGLGFSLTAGTDTSLLIHCLNKYDQKDQYRSIEAKSQSYIFIAILISGIIGAIIAEIDINLPFYLTVPFNLIASFIVMKMEEGETVSNNDKAKKEKIGIPWKSMHVILFYAVNRGTIMTFYILVLPLTLFVNTHISIGFFGMILGLYSLTAFLTGRYMVFISKKYGDKFMWVIVPVVLIVSCFLSTFSWIGMYLFISVLLGFASGLVRPLSYGALNKLGDKERAKAVAIAEFLFAFLNMIFYIMIAAMFQRNINSGLTILIIMVSVLSLYQLMHYQVVRKKTDLK